MTCETSSIDAIVSLMRDNWDMPADCNDGELYTYAEHLRDRIKAGDDAARLADYLHAIQTEILDMPDSAAYRLIAQGALAILRAGAGPTNEKQAGPDNAASMTDEALSCLDDARCRGIFRLVTLVVGAVMSSVFFAEIESAGPDVVR